MKENNKKSGKAAVVKPVISLLMICVVSTALLAYVHEATKAPIAAAEEAARMESAMMVLPDGTSDIEEIKLENASELCFAAKNSSGEVVAYAIGTSSHGYGGEIKVMTGIDKDGTIIAVNVYDNSSETPGLGANTSEESFVGGFAGKKALGVFAVSKDADKYDGCESIDAVTGATISSRAVASAVTRAGEIFKQLTMDN